MIAASQAKPMDTVKAPAPVQASFPNVSTTESDSPLPSSHSFCSISCEQIYLASPTDLLLTHLVKAFPSVWDIQFAPMNMGTGSHCYYMYTAPNCEFRASKIGPVWSHIAAAHTLKEAACLECDVLFLSPYSMKEHMFLHFPEHKPGSKSSSK